ncbi:autophagy-related protein 22-2 [Westerdykella ornata]|uniref:Autophagy-related protein n=1 Tax=Westerdykella ornata TaxID=318751 RepID=A0A6A6JLN1_WESOR|nr:autophagy-related protein 22-2 [Westerdykella ornata]KAF2277570.1 autophagy-related protein 22-2 [Westerdykella ornata]
MPPPPPEPLPHDVANEADDEQSLSEGDSEMEDRQPLPLYEGEDVRLTSKQELFGFYMYGWAAEVFVVCGIGSFIPVTLEQLARENGVLLSDRSTPCKSALESSAPSIWSSNPPRGAGQQCIVYIMGFEINTASFAMYTFSISVLLQALLIVSMSGAADHGRFRKTLLLWFAFVGSIATMLFLPMVPKLYIMAAVLAIIANTCFGASFVLLNSFLPLLVRHHPEVQFPDGTRESSLLDEGDLDRLIDPTFPEEEQYTNHVNSGERSNHTEGIPNETSALLPHPTLEQSTTTIPTPASHDLISLELTLSTQISSQGIAIGYLAALIVQTLSILIVLNFGAATLGLRTVLFLIGAWWFVFSLPTAFWLRPRPGPPLHLATSSSLSRFKHVRVFWAYFAYSWRSLGRTLTHATHLKDILLFLLAWFLLSDSIATVSGTAVLFAKTTLGMSYAMLALINVIATTAGVIGAFAWSRISRYMRLSPSQTILACIALFELIPLYGLLGYIPAIRRWGSLGLQQQWEMYPLGAVYGFVLGGLSSYCRSVYGEMVPRGWEAAFFALYAITDKGSSVFGPAVVGAITDRWGEIRPAFWFLAVLIGLPFPIMLLVDVDRGKADGIALVTALVEENKTEQEQDAEADRVVAANHINGLERGEQHF